MRRLLPPPPTEGENSDPQHDRTGGRWYGDNRMCLDEVVQPRFAPGRIAVEVDVESSGPRLDVQQHAAGERAIPGELERVEGDWVLRVCDDACDREVDLPGEDVRDAIGPGGARASARPVHWAHERRVREVALQDVGHDVDGDAAHGVVAGGEAGQERDGRTLAGHQRRVGNFDVDGLGQDARGGRGACALGCRSS
eukprot:TRINITY_DN27366_c0_g1_i12.p5 TRINITY_DN27366_c0_g1~~TRINITY_DN27366_c0_g1_i12.p5  ORF type:complete len:196 (-),score=39.93 TRINITY_DN27366_c0_g1_i12:13-600(-)